MSRRGAQVAFATYWKAPRLLPPERGILPALAALGIEARPERWTDPDVDWGSYDAVVVRSIWDYFRHYPKFLRWVNRVSARTTLWNPPEVLRWNSHKRYLLDMEARGVPIVPTVLGSQVDSVERAMRERGWESAVLKPAVSGGAWRTHRLELGHRTRNEELLRRLRRHGEVLLQPYVQEVEEHGERSLVHFAGRFSHAVIRRPALAEATRLREGTPCRPTPRELQVAASALRAAPRPTLYGRVDLCSDGRGKVRLMELEVIEPFLFLGASPGAIDRYAAAIAAAL